MKTHAQHVSKPWGFEEIVCNHPEYCGKLLHINPSQQTSWHYHKKKDEHFHVLHGRLVLYYGTSLREAESQVITLYEGDGFHIPVGVVHRLVAPIETTILEISTHHEDSDSIRLA